ncbi:ABC transporter ATP-binding protein [Parendozoicomonas haliclonae]|uniref:Spermidine/putrescine import ATP-binding protein PotA n=1 Tax=Parendozoicomonas haliclonae TaxID=1960125 RepID=A0A1X7AG12_9GAMM|nr:ABC transporter ATP-binding protein [Parendozoicomonas haliclonae]SMA38764.1 Spermidine/putrescine import ATP-binding protein PotA [Parendozoicomonas haliclonae]
MTSDIDLSCTDLNKNFGSYQAVDNVSFQIPRGSFFSILGPSGCGKTTLLRMIAGFLEPESGGITIKGDSMLGIPPNKRPVNMVFQHLALFPMMSVADNIGYGLRRRKMKASEIKKKVADALERVGLPDVGDRAISQLSGGQKQRIAIARCLVLEPDVLLLDEPLGALDLKLREHMKVELKKLQQAFGTTFIYITHDQSEAMVMSDQVAVMNNGRFEQVGTPQELYYQPDTPFVAGFVGESNHFSGQVVGRNGDVVEVKTASGQVFHSIERIDTNLAAGDEVELFVRPEMIHLSFEPENKPENALEGEVANILFDGGNSRLLIREATTGAELQVVQPQTTQFRDVKAGDRLYLSWAASQSHIFRARGQSQTPALMQTVEE